MSKEYRGQIAEAPMTESWKHLQGQTVNGEFELREYLGGSAHGAEFLTEYDHQTASIHLISENAPDKDRRLASWQLGTEVSHPNLVRVFQVGLWPIDDANFFYAVMELPDENLGQILTQRALTAEETTAMLSPALDALSYLHKRDLVHGAVNPASIGAIGDQLKLSIGSLARSGEAIGEPGAYDPPEMTSSAASDVWSLGMMLVEVLTRQLPPWQRYGEGDPELSANLPAPLVDIVRNCLRRDARRRWTIRDIEKQLNPGSADATTENVSEAPPAKSVEPPSATAASVIQAQPVKPTTAANNRRPAQSYGTSRETTAVPPQPSTYQYRAPARSSPKAKPGYLTPALILLAVLAAFAGFKLLNRPTTAPPEIPASSTPSAANSAGTANTENAAPPQKEQPAPVEKSSRPISSNTPAADGTSRSRETSNAGSETSGVMHQMLPDVPEKAARTIHGKFHVTVRVATDAAGNVTDASLDSAGPSQYFANLSLKAAREWKFATQDATSGDWLIRFEFTAAGTTASAKPVLR